MRCIFVRKTYSMAGIIYKEESYEIIGAIYEVYNKKDEIR